MNMAIINRFNACELTEYIGKTFQPIHRIDPRSYTLKHKLCRKICPAKFTDSHPLKLLYVDPNDINSYISADNCKSDFGRVCDGDWDLTCQDFTETRVYKSHKNRIKHNTPWEETSFFKGLVNLPDDAVWGREYKTEEDALKRLSDFDILTNKLREEGYKSQRVLLKERPNETKYGNNDAIHPIFNEICIHIGRSGELLWKKRGLNRLAISKTLELSEIAVLPIVRHAKWQNIRNTIRNNGVTPETKHLSKHPDLTDII